MNTVIIYSTRKGSTEKIVQKMKSICPGPVDLVDPRSSKECDPAQYDCIIIGGPVHVSNPDKKIRDFCIQYQEILTGKKLGLFITALAEDKIDESFQKYFGQKLIDSAVCKDWFGGEVDLKKYNFLVRKMLKSIMKTDGSIFNLKMERVEPFMRKLLKSEK